MWKPWVGTLLVALFISGCGPDENTWGDDDVFCEDGACDIWGNGTNIPAICSVNVTGHGTVSVEDDYLPHVIMCENGSASFEALRAQAVAARTYLYYSLAGRRSIASGEGTQVYACGAQPRQEHYDAVRSTAGQVIGAEGLLICSFYVAGAIPSSSTCAARSSDSDPTGTEWAVTYNICREGDDVTPSPLGSRSDPKNRGAMSQNGSDCLSDAGWSYHQILRFYYGDDIEIGHAQGSCIEPPYEPTCGDGTCDIGESCGGCYVDCGSCSHDCYELVEPEPCSVSGVSGTCIDIADCDPTTHLSTPGLCPGASSVQCCTPRNGYVDPDPDPDPDPEAECVVNGVEGACLDIAQCPEDTFQATPGYCPGDWNIQCCTPTTCTAGGVEGLCMDITECDSATHVTTSGLCPGPWNIQCCTPR